MLTLLSIVEVSKMSSLLFLNTVKYALFEDFIKKTTTTQLSQTLLSITYLKNMFYLILAMYFFKLLTKPSQNGRKNQIS